MVTIHRSPAGGSVESPMVEVVVILRPPSQKSGPTPAQSKKMATAILRHASQETGLKPVASTIFENMHSFSVKAAKRYVEALAKSGEVAKILTNNSEVPELISPVEVSRVEFKPQL